MAYEQIPDQPGMGVMNMGYGMAPGMDNESMGYDQRPKDDKPPLMEVLQKLAQYSEDANIAASLDESKLGEIAGKVKTGFEIDESSMASWLDKAEKALELAKLEAEKKSFPWPDAANVKYPLLTMASVQFASRALPEIVPSKQVVKAGVTGADPQGGKAMRADRISKHMSWQVTRQMRGWTAGMDRMLHQLPLVGSVIKKSYFDPVLGHNVSDPIPLGDCVVNQNVRDIEAARRVTHRIYMYHNELIEKQRSGEYLDVDIGDAKDEDAPGEDSATHELWEQHRWLDLDNDGYEEPYIVTVDKNTNKVLRIVARYYLDGIKHNGEQVVSIKANCYFTKYDFIPDPSGGFLGVGFGHLLYPLNETINTIINQTLDAGTLANAGGGIFSSEVGIKSGVVRVKPGEFIRANAPAESIAKSFYAWPVPQPSPVLFNLLGMLNEAAREMMATQSISMDNIPANMPATTVLATIEQGQKVFNGIYQRIWTAAGEEYSKLYKLNAKYLNEEEYFTVLDEQMAIARQDYAMGDFDVYPAGDPSVSSDMQRAAKSQAMMDTVGMPGVNSLEVVREFYMSGIKVDDVDRFVAKELPPPQPDPKVIIEGMKLDLKAQELAMKEREARAKIEETIARALKTLAEAEAQEAGTQIALYMQELQAIRMDLDITERATRMIDEGQTGASGNVTPGVGGTEAAGGPGMAGQPGNMQGAPLPVGAAPSLPGAPM